MSRRADKLQIKNRRVRQEIRYDTVEKDVRAHQGETVDQFLARGGKITKLPPADPEPPKTGPKAGTGARMPARA